MTLDEIVRYLEGMKDGIMSPSLKSVSEQIGALRTDAVMRGSESEAKEFWVLGAVLSAHAQYLEAYRLLGLKKFYDAWCMLERCEITLAAVERHALERWNDFGLDFVSEHVTKWQSIFPYKTFFSPEYIEHRKECSICGLVVLPRTGCSHRLGEIYGGEMCCHIITGAEPISVSLVDNPVQKYSVAFPSHPATGEKGDFYNYAAVEYTRSIMLSPFDRWSVERTTKLWPHSHFLDLGRNDPCPCGSAKKYKKCCLPADGVVMPHLVIRGASEAPSGIPQEFLSRARRTSRGRRSLIISTRV